MINNMQQLWIVNKVTINLQATYNAALNNKLRTPGEEYIIVMNCKKTIVVNINIDIVHKLGTPGEENCIR